MTGNFPLRACLLTISIIPVCVLAESETAREPVDPPPITLPAQAPPELQADQPAQLETLIVTATKRAMPIDDVPASIGYLDGAALEKAGAAELRDFLPRVPGIQQTEVFPEFNRISVRGIQADAAAVTPAATGYFVDDIPFSDPFVLHARPDLPPFDLEAIEVLKGPQGSLFGASSLAGALRYRLQDARLGEHEGRGFLQYETPTDGGFNQLAGLVVNRPLGDNTALRLVGSSRLGGGRIDDLRNDLIDTDKSRRYSGRALLRWDAGGDWSVGVKAIAQRSFFEDVPVAETTDGRLQRERALVKAPMRARFGFGSLDLRYRMAWGDLVSVTSLVDKAAFLSGANGARGLGVEAAGQPVDLPTREQIHGFMQEIRLVSPATDSPWQWLGGLYLHRYADLSTQRATSTEANSGAQAVLLDFVADISARELSAFGEVSRTFGERWGITLGGRLYQVQTAGEVVSTGAIILATGASENRNDANIKEAGFNPKLAVQYGFSDELRAYLSVARGFRFGGIQIVGPSPSAPDVPATYKSDTLWNYEIGLRSRWLEDALQADASVYYIDWQDPQMQSRTGGAVPLNIIDNIGHARSYGGELQLSYRPPIRGLSLSAAAAWTDARSTQAYTTPSGAEAEPGARLPGTAREQYVANIEYGWTWAGSALGLGLHYTRQGRGVSDILQSLSIYDYDTTDLRLRLENQRWLGPTQIVLGINNIADHRAVTQALVISESNFTTMYNNTRTYVLRVNFAW